MKKEKKFELIPTISLEHWVWEVVWVYKSLEPMEKLIELLNEYEKENKSDLYYKFELENWELYCYNDVSDVLWTMQDEAMVICSKKFWFIKWLVENEKIDFWTRNPLFITELVGEQEKQIPYSFYEEMLIRLAVSDTPIEDLISYLK